MRTIKLDCFHFFPSTNIFVIIRKIICEGTQGILVSSSCAQNLKQIQTAILLFWKIALHCNPYVGYS
jgi:hypothetical protein